MSDSNCYLVFFDLRRQQLGSVPRNLGKKVRKNVVQLGKGPPRAPSAREAAVAPMIGGLPPPDPRHFFLF